MAGDLDWVFELVDKSTPALDKIQKKLDAMPRSAAAVEAAMKKAEEALALKKIDRIKDPIAQAVALLKHRQAQLAGNKSAFGKFVEGISPANAILTGFATSGATAAIGALEHIASGAVHAGVEFAKFVLEAAAGKRTLLASLSVFEGGAAEKTMKVIEDLAIESGISADETVKAFTKLRTAGFSAKESQDILAASLDIGAQMGGGAGGAAAADSFRGLIEKIDILSKGSAKDLMKAVRDAGVPIEALDESVAARLKITTDKAKDMLAAGQVNEKILQESLLDAVQNKIDAGGPLGSRAKKHGHEDPGAALNALKNRFSNLFDAIDMKPFAEAIWKVTTALSGPAGEKMGQIAEGAVNFGAALVGSIDVPATIDRIVAGCDLLWASVQEVAKGFGQAFDSKVFKDTLKFFDDGTLTAGDLKSVCHDIGVILGTAAKSVEVIVKGFEVAQKYGSVLSSFSPVGQIKNIYDSASKAGGQAVMGLENASARGAAAAGENMGNKFAAGTRSSLDIYSPSRVMAELGEYSAMGFQKGWDGQAPSIDDFSAPSVSSLGGGRSIEINIGDINVSGSAEAGRAVRDQVRDQLISLFEEMGMH
jgi:hypothetical protein